MNKIYFYDLGIRNRNKLLANFNPLEYRMDVGSLYGFEFKFKAKKIKAPASWVENYLHAGFQQINREFFLDFVT